MRGCYSSRRDSVSFTGLPSPRSSQAADWRGYKAAAVFGFNLRIEIARLLVVAAIVPRLILLAKAGCARLRLISLRGWRYGQ